MIMAALCDLHNNSINSTWIGPLQQATLVDCCTPHPTKGSSAIMSTKNVICILSLALPAILTSLSPEPAEGGSCERPELEWSVWRDHVLASNPGTDFFELRGDGRDELLRAHSCLASGENCPPDQLMVFHCMGNSRVLIAFVKAGCVTRANDIAIENYQLYVTGGVPC